MFALQSKTEFCASSSLLNTHTPPPPTKSHSLFQIPSHQESSLCEAWPLLSETDAGLSRCPVTSRMGQYVCELGAGGVENGTSLGILWALGLNLASHRPLGTGFRGPKGPTSTCCTLPSIQEEGLLQTAEFCLCCPSSSLSLLLLRASSEVVHPAPTSNTLPLETQLHAFPVTSILKPLDTPYKPC